MRPGRYKYFPTYFYERKNNSFKRSEENKILHYNKRIFSPENRYFYLIESRSVVTSLL